MSPSLKRLVPHAVARCRRLHHAVSCIAHRHWKCMVTWLTCNQFLCSVELLCLETLCFALRGGHGSQAGTVPSSFCAETLLFWRLWCPERIESVFVQMYTSASLPLHRSLRNVWRKTTERGSLPWLEIFMSGCDPVDAIMTCLIYVCKATVCVKYGWEQYLLAIG